MRDDGWSFRHDRSGTFTGIEVSSLPTDQPVLEAAHASLSTPPDGRFAKLLVVQRRDATGVDTIRGCLLAPHRGRRRHRDRARVVRRVARRADRRHPAQPGRPRRRRAAGAVRRPVGQARGVDGGRPAVTWRLAGPDDAEVLRDLEREANLVGLAHVFPGLSFPDEGVLERWRATLGRAGGDRPVGRRRVHVVGHDRSAAPPGRAPGPLGHGTGPGGGGAGGRRRSGRPAAHPCCGCWSPTTGPAGSTSTSVGSPPAGSSRPSGRRTRQRSSTACENPGHER